MSERYLVRYDVNWDTYNNHAGQRFIETVWPEDSVAVQDILVEFQGEKPVRAAKLALFHPPQSALASPYNAAIRPLEWVPVACQPEDFISEQKEVSA